VFNRPVGELSKGFRQRVGLAAAILHRPDLLVLDEPTEGLDPNQRVEIRRLISALGRERTVVLSTHVLPEVQFTCSRLLIINRGKIVADGDVETLVGQATAGIRISVEASGQNVEQALGRLEGVSGVQRQESLNGRVKLSVTAVQDVRAGIFELAKAEGWVLYDLHQEAGSLEDLFRQLTAGEAAT
ncbi:MAG TPA: AAA family ATPase, partial [Gemmatimonadales bacterium]